MRGLARWRRSAFGLGCAAFFLSFFHRVSTGAIAADLQHEFAIGAAALGTLGAAYFYVYALMQVPAGVLADTLGPRVMLTASMLIAGIGSLAYGLAGSFAAAVSARAVIGFGVTAVFVCTLKLHANWFGERRFSTAVGISNVSGICGALAATAPLAWLVTLVSWRDVHIAIGIYSLVLAVAIWAGVRDAPAPDSGRIAPGEWRRALAQVACNRATWAPFWVCFCTAGSFLTFVGLWAVPYLNHVHGMGAVAASTYPALSLAAFACCVPLTGWLSDRLGVRKPIVMVSAAASGVAGLIWLLLPASSTEGAAIAAVFTGLAAPGFTLAWSIVKEVNPPERAGTAIALANIGAFVASGILQPLVGWVVDSGAGVVAGGSPDAYRLGIGVLAAWAATGMVAAVCLTETRCRNVWGHTEPVLR